MEHTSSYRSVFGPIRSRRLGLSLGIDPIGSKICSFNCVYCEIEKTQVLTVERKMYISPDVVLDELADFFKLHPNVKPDYISISGKGEPTLNSHLKTMIERIKERYPYPICVITNSSLLHLKEVRDDIAAADLILPSLDAVSERNFVKINLPHRSIRMRDIIQGIKLLCEEFKGEVWLEILFVKSINDSPDELQKLKEQIRYIRPHRIYVNTVYRPPSFSHAKPLSVDELKQIQTELSSVLDKEHVFWKQVNQKDIPARLKTSIDVSTLEQKLKDILSVRPSSSSDLLYILQAHGYHLSKEFLAQQLQHYISKGVLHSEEGFESTYYKWINANIS